MGMKYFYIKINTDITKRTRVPGNKKKKNMPKKQTRRTM